MSETEHRDTHPPLRPIPEVVSLLKQGRLIPITRAFRDSDEKLPEIIVAFEQNSQKTSGIRKLDVLAIPMSEIQLAKDWFAEKKFRENTARLVFERFMRGVSASSTTRYMTPPLNASSLEMLDSENDIVID